MALPAVGPISMNAMQIEAGGISGTQVSLFDNWDCRLLIKVGLGPQPASPGLSIRGNIPAYDPDAWGGGGGTNTGLSGLQGFANSRYYFKGTATGTNISWAKSGLSNDNHVGSGSTPAKIGSGQISLSMWQGAASNTGDTWDMSVNGAYSYPGNLPYRHLGNSEEFLTVLETTGDPYGAASYSGRIIYSPESNAATGVGYNYYSDDLGDNWTSVTIPTITSGSSQNIGNSLSGSIASDHRGNVIMSYDSGFWWYSTNGGVSYTFGGQLAMSYSRISYTGRIANDPNSGYWFMTGYNYSGAQSLIYYKSNPTSSWTQSSVATSNFAVDRVTHGLDIDGGGWYMATGKPWGLNGSYTGGYLLASSNLVYWSDLSNDVKTIIQGGPGGVTLSQSSTWVTQNKPQHILWDSTITMPNSKTQGGFVMVGGNTIWIRYYHTSNYWDTIGYDLTTLGTDATDNFMPYGGAQAAPTKAFREIQKDLNSGDYIIAQADGYYMQCKGGNDADGMPFILSYWNWTWAALIAQGGASFADMSEGVWSPTHNKLIYVAGTTIMMTPADPAVDTYFISPANYGYTNRSAGFTTHSANPHYYA